LTSAVIKRRAIFRLLGTLPWAGAAWAGVAEVPLPVPPLDGSFSAEIAPLLFPGAPTTRVEVTARTSAAGVRELVFHVRADGLTLDGDATLGAGGEGEWRLKQGVVDLAVWSGPAISRLASAGAGAARGRLRITAAGSWRGGVWGGAAEFALEQGGYENPGKKLSLSGVSARVRIPDLRNWRSEPGQVLEWEGGRFDALAVGAGRVRFRLEDNAVHIEEAAVAVLGGELSVVRASVAFNAASYSLAARMSGVQLAELLPFLPPLLASARGRLDGRISLRSDADGVRIDSGHLALRAGETAELRFLPTPGVISGQLPQLVRQYYPGLLQLESGGSPLRAERLEVVMNASGDETGRTAVVSLEGGPSDPALRAPVVIQVNVRGPLDQVVAFGTHSRLRFSDTR
jgi:hypothetical protein